MEEQTLEQWTLERLVGHGMFPQQAEQVIAQCKNSPALAPMRKYWEESYEAESPLTLVVWHSVKREALAWIDANLPRAWYRPMFL